MSRDVHAIPPAPRGVRWSAVLPHRWPIALLGALLAFFGSVGALLLVSVWAASQRRDAALDAGQLAVIESVITAVDPIQKSYRGAPAARVRYTFELATGLVVHGQSYGPAADFDEGGHARVEYDPDQPATNRLVGTNLSLWPDLVTPLLWIVVAPGLLLIALWAAQILQLRRTLARGDIALAELLRVEQITGVMPLMLRAQYRFRDRHAQWREGMHWVRARSPLGMALAERPRHSATAHDRRHPERSHLVVPADFQHRRAPHAKQPIPRA